MSLISNAFSDLYIYNAKAIANIPNPLTAASILNEAAR